MIITNLFTLVNTGSTALNVVKGSMIKGCLKNIKTPVVNNIRNMDGNFIFVFLSLLTGEQGTRIIRCVFSTEIANSFLLFVESFVKILYRSPLKII